MAKQPGLYTQPQAFEPLMPQAGRARLADLTCEILLKSGELHGGIPTEINRRRIVALMREMNSYYSNLIEGHKTLPRDIERALNEDYSSNEERRANQHLARAHVEVEELMLHCMEADASLPIHSQDFLCWLHREFYSRIPRELHFAKDRKGKRYSIKPGEMRDFEVSVGSHQPPHSGALPKFLNRFQKFYDDPKILRTNQLVALAAAHHRLAWIHPFGDGNGRVCRLYSHAWLARAGVSPGLWTLSRGLARDRERYYAELGKADQQRKNDFDGRGNLSDGGLASFCVFMLETMLDQIKFMGGLLQLSTLSTRIERFVQLELVHLSSRTAERLIRLLKAALFEGEIERGRVAEIVGLGSTAAREIIRLALREGVVESATGKSALMLVFSSRTLESYFPQLFQNLP